MAEVASAYIALIPSFKGGASAISQELDGPLTKASGDAGEKSGKAYGSKFGAGAGGLLKAAVGAAVVAGAADFVRDAIGEARESQKVAATTEQIIKSTGGAAKLTADQVGNLATAISNKTGMDDEAIQSGANLLLTFKNVKNELGEGNDVFNRATAAAADLSAAGFGDLNGASKQLGKALNDPIAGISALSRSGVTFTEQQKEQIKTLVASGDTLAAQKIILKEVESQVGGTAAASATGGEKMAVAFGNFKESVGTALLPALDGLMGVLTTVFGFLGQNQPLVIGLAAAVGAFAVAWGVYTVAQWAANTAMFASPITWITLGVLAIIAGIVLLATHMDQVKEFFAKAWEKILAAVTTVWNWVKANWPLLLAIITGPIGLAVLWVIQHFDQIKAKVSEVVGAVVDWFRSVPGKIGAAFSTLAQVITAPFRSAFNLVASLWNRTIGSLDLHIPDWIPGIGGKGFSFPKLPLLAEGGVVSRPTLAVVGEGSEDEAIMPLSKLRGMLATAADGGTGLPRTITLLDQDGSILAHTRVIADGAVAGAQTAARRAATSRGLRTIAVGG
jgi:hypothetical protein